MKLFRFSRSVAGACAAAAILAGCNGAGSQTGIPPGGLSAPSISGVTSNAHVAPGVVHYYISLLGTPSGSSSYANGINDQGWITGAANPPDSKVGHASLWINGHRTDLGTLGGKNSSVNWPVKSNQGYIAGESDTAQKDPLDEKFCGSGTGTHICLGFLWKNNVMTPLPTLGGNNAQATGVNNRGAVTGVAETSTSDPSCVAPQALDYFATVWQPDGTTIALPPIAGDTVSQAIAINNAGQVAGASGPCGPPLSPAYGATHAVLWHTGTAIDLGNLGGSAFNAAAAMNDKGQIVGISGLPGNTTYHAFLWQSGVMRDLGTLPGDVQSVAFGLNNKGQAVGQSCNAKNRCRAVLWENGATTDLNLLVAHSPIYLTYGGDINDQGWIAGDGRDRRTGRTRAFVLLPGSNGGLRIGGAK